MSFQISGLRDVEFAHLFGQPEEALSRHAARRMTVTTKPGFPCRLTLEDAEPGETVLLVNYEHLAVDGPYRASHAVFVREGARSITPLPDEIPESLAIRLLSLRAFDRDGMMLDADVVHGSELREVIERMLDDANVEWIDVHNAKPGCFAARVTRSAC